MTERVCLALLVVLAIFIIWRASGGGGGGGGRAGPMMPADAPPMRPDPKFVQIEVPGTVIKPPIIGASLGPMKEVAASHLGGDPKDDPASGRFRYVGLGGMSCPNKRWYDSVYNGGFYTEIDEPGIARKDMNYESADLMVILPRDPDAVGAFPEPVAEKDLLAHAHGDPWENI